MAGDGEHYPPSAGLAELKETGDGRSTGWLDKESFILCKPALCSENLFVGNDADPALTFRKGGVAPAQLAGLPMRIAVATVFGASITRLWKIGAEPAAWKPIMRGSRVERLSSRDSPSSRR